MLLQSMGPSVFPKAMERVSHTISVAVFAHLMCLDADVAQMPQHSRHGRTMPHGLDKLPLTRYLGTAFRACGCRSPREAVPSA